MVKRSRRSKKKRRGRKREQVPVSTGFKEFIRDEKRRIQKEQGVKPSEEDIIIDRMDVDEEEFFEDEDPDFMDLF